MKTKKFYKNRAEAIAEADRLNLETSQTWWADRIYHKGAYRWLVITRSISGNFYIRYANGEMTKTA